MASTFRPERSWGDPTAVYSLICVAWPNVFLNELHHTFMCRAVVCTAACVAIVSADVTWQCLKGSLLGGWGLNWCASPLLFLKVKDGIQEEGKRQCRFFPSLERGMIRGPGEEKDRCGEEDKFFSLSHTGDWVNQKGKRKKKDRWNIFPWGRGNEEKSELPSRLCMWGKA